MGRANTSHAYERPTYRFVCKCWVIFLFLHFAKHVPILVDELLIRTDVAEFAWGDWRKSIRRTRGIRRCDIRAMP